jgi:hypothetical protein
MHAVYELWLWILYLILLRNPDFHHGLLVGQVAEFHRQFAVDMDHVDRVVHGVYLDEANRSWLSLNRPENIRVGVNEEDRVSMRNEERLPLGD